VSDPNPKPGACAWCGGREFDQGKYAVDPFCVACKTVVGFNGPPRDEDGIRPNAPVGPEHTHTCPQCRLPWHCQNALEYPGWEDPRSARTLYCPLCWPVVRAERARMRKAIEKGRKRNE